MNDRPASNHTDLSYLATKVEFHEVTDCPWCGSTDLRHMATRGDGLDVKRCADCHLGFLGALPDDLEVFYDDSYYSRNPVPGAEPPTSGYDDYERAYAPMSFRWLSSLIAAIVPERGRLFDFGAATGSFLDMARQEGFEVAGSELTHEGAAAAVSKGLNVREGFFKPSDWDRGGFNVVTALEVLEHVTDVRETLSGLKDLLTDDGILVFSVPNVIDRIVDDFGDDAIDFNKSFEHTLYFNPETLTTIFEEVFGPDCLTLHTAESSVWDQPVSSALGIVRVTQPPERRERVLLDCVQGSAPVAVLETTGEAIAVALSAARFAEPAIADAAIDRAEVLGASDAVMATVRAQVLRQRGEIYAAFRTIEACVSNRLDIQDPLATPLMLEIFDDLTALIAIGESGFATGLQRIHERLDTADGLSAALGTARTADPEQDRALSDADWLGRLPERLEEARRRTLQAELESRDLQYLFAESEIDRVAAVETVDELQNRVDTYVQRLYDIHHSRMWKLWTLVWRLKATIRRQKPIEDQPTLTKATPESKVPTLHTPREFPVSVSVIMPVYNKGDSIRESIDSVLAQTYASIEVIVWDDGSTDEGTKEALAEIDTRETVTVTRAENQGVVGARNAAMNLASGEFFVCLDPDDRFEPTYIEKAVAYLRSHPDISIVYPWQRTVGDKAEVWETHQLDPVAIVENNHVPVCAVFRREVFESTGGFSTEMRAGYEDWEFWAHAAALGFNGRAIPEALFEYTYSDDPTKSRDAEARSAKTELAAVIRDRYSNAVIDTTKTSPPVPRWIESGRPRFAPGTGRPVVLMLPWVTVGGADKVVENLVRHWGTTGRTVVVITTLGVSDEMENRLDDLLIATPYVYELPNYLPRHLWYPFVRDIVNALGEPTILNIGSTWFFEHAMRLKLDVPTVRIVDQQFNDSGHIAGNRMARGAIDTTVTAYEGLREALGEAGSMTVTNIYIGIEPPTVTNDDQRESRSELGLAPGEKFAVFVGRLSEEKRPEWIVPLADVLHEGGHKMVVIGDGPLAKRHSRSFEDHPAIIWRRHVTDPIPVIAASSVTTVPSRIEGIPLTAMESLAVGTPVVATAVGGLPELADVPGVILVSPDGLDEFVKAARSSVDSAQEEPISLPAWLGLAHALSRYDDVVDPDSTGRNAQP